jgi:RimJ/RimL family protein N-acetyltransferase
MVINKDTDIVLKVPEEKDMEILEKWYGMHDYFGHATGFKNFSDISSKFKEPVDPSILSFMIYNIKTGIPIGFIYGYLKDASRNSVLWISIFIIDPAFQNKGYGTHALNKLLDLAKREYGIAACIVAVSYKNKQGLSFWEKVGFSHDPELEQSLHHFGTSQAAIMKRIIKQ